MTSANTRQACPPRKDWLIDWLKSAIDDNAVLVRNVSEVLGRLCFAAQAVSMIRPFLGPCYAWVASIGLDTFMQLPVGLKVIFRFLIRLLDESNGRELIKPITSKAPLIFRADAKAEGTDVALGGWLCHPGGTRESKWFAVQITPGNAPWAFWAGEAFRTIASLELFASLLCLMIFAPEDDSFGVLRFTGETDNRGNSFVVQKLMSTKYPLNVVLMELAMQLHQKGIALNLEWVRRELNQEADDLSNFRFDDFQKENRIEVDLDSFKFILLDEFMKSTGELYKKVASAREAKKRDLAARGAPSIQTKGKKRPLSEKLKQKSHWG